MKATVRQKRPTPPTKTTTADRQEALRLFDPRRGDVALKLDTIGAGTDLSQPQRANYFTVLWIREGRGCCHADLVEHRFQSPALLFFNPYQAFFLEPQAELRGVRLQFHANFFCIETHHEEVGCDGVLFNDVFGVPLVQLDEHLGGDFDELISQMERELAGAGLARSELIVSYLKVFLIRATRLKLAQQCLPARTAVSRPTPVLERLRLLIEQHYRTMHRPAEYAAALHITPKALGKQVKARFGRTLTELIHERLIKHAKWQLLHTLRPVKEVAWEIGFADEHYFSRLFKRATGCAPTAFREFETAIRGGRNLSMQRPLPSLSSPEEAANLTR